MAVKFSYLSNMVFFINVQYFSLNLQLLFLEPDLSSFQFEQLIDM